MYAGNSQRELVKKFVSILKRDIPQIYWVLVSEASTYLGLWPCVVFLEELPEY